MSKIELQDFVEFGRLFEVYGKLLSEDRQSIMTNYFEYNMTLAEIAKERNCSRQAVLDAVDKSCQKLKEYEATLEICKKKEKVKEQLAKLKEVVSEDLKEKVEEILKEI